AEILERLGTAFIELVLPLRALRQRPYVADLLAIRDRVRDELTLDEAIDKAAGERVLCADRIAGRAHFERLPNPRHSGQPLRSARARQEAKLHFRRAQLRRRNRNAIMAGERDLEAAAERRPVDRGHYGL